MTKRLFFVLSVILMMLTATADPADAHGCRRRQAPKPKPLWACQVAPEIRGIPCYEIDRAVTEAAAEFLIDEYRFRKLVTCESTFDPAPPGYFGGLTQQHPEFWPGRVREFNANVAVPNGGNRHHPFDNARLGARQVGLGQAWWQFPACHKYAGFYKGTSPHRHQA